MDSQMPLGMCCFLVSIQIIISLFDRFREAFAPDLPIIILAAHKFLKSIHNTTIERGWLRLRLQWGDNVIVFWEAGCELYDPLDPVQE